MSNTTRIFVYLGGFFIGMLLVSLILSRRAVKDEGHLNPEMEHHQKMLQAGAEPLPAGVPASIQQGVLVDFGYLPRAGAPAEAVWMLKFEESYPYVRVVQDIETKQLTYMAADQITIHLAEGVDVSELKPMLDELGLRLRMFTRKERLVVVGVLSTSIDAIPMTIEAVQPWAKLYKSAEPDFLRFQPKKPNK